MEYICRKYTIASGFYASRKIEKLKLSYQYSRVILSTCYVL
jgi:hypothetical protein